MSGRAHVTSSNGIGNGWYAAEARSVTGDGLGVEEICGLKITSGTRGQRQEEWKSSSA